MGDRGGEEGELEESIRTYYSIDRNPELHTLLLFLSVLWTVVCQSYDSEI